MSVRRLWQLAPLFCRQAYRKGAMMKITSDDLRQQFDVLCAATVPREEIAGFALRAMEANDAGLLEIEHAFADRIWKGILYLSGVDLRVEPEQYLHSADDFIEAREALGV